MFIRRVKKSNKSVSVRIVESIRNKNGSVDQKLVKIVGTGRTEEEINILERAAREMILHLDPNPRENKFKEVNDIPDDVTFNSVKEAKRINDGIVDIFGALYDKYGFNNIINNTYKDDQWNYIIKMLTLARIARPASKRRTSIMLSNEYLSNIPLEKIYRSMDRLYLFENDIKNNIFEHSKELSGGKINVMLFDVTTLYFESMMDDSLRKRGFSKDCKFKEVQIVLSLTTTEKGLPIDYSLFPGNTSEGKTLIEYIKKIKNQYKVEDVTLIADRAMFNENNLLELEKENIKYIVACKLKSLTKKIKEAILTDNDYHANLLENELCWAKDYSYKDRRLVVSYSTKRARRDKYMRELLIERILKKTKNDKIRVSELINNNGTKKFVKLTKDNIVEIDHDKINKDAMWDGLHGIITNDKETNSFLLLSQYRQLWRVEEAFRINKHDLKMRPIFHWKPNRVKAHILLSYQAFALGKFAIEELKEKNVRVSLDVLREELSQVESSIFISASSSAREFYLSPSPLNEDQQIIYDAFDIVRRVTPWSPCRCRPQ